MLVKKKRRLPRVAAGDIELLEMLWREGPVTLAEAQSAMERPVGYTTVQTRLNRLVSKGLASRTATRPAQYSAAIARDDVSRSDLSLLVQRVNEGQVVPLVAHLVRDRTLTPGEIESLKSLIAEAEARSDREMREDAP